MRASTRALRYPSVGPHSPTEEVAIRRRECQPPGAHLRGAAQEQLEHCFEALEGGIGEVGALRGPRLRVRLPERLGARPRLERLARLPGGVGGVERLALAARPAQQVEAAEAGHAVELRVARAPERFEAVLEAPRDAEAVHGDEHAEGYRAARPASHRTGGPCGELVARTRRSPPGQSASRTRCSHLPSGRSAGSRQSHAIGADAEAAAPAAHTRSTKAR